MVTMVTTVTLVGLWVAWPGLVGGSNHIFAVVAVVFDVVVMSVGCVVVVGPPPSDPAPPSSTFRSPPIRSSGQRPCYFPHDNSTDKLSVRSAPPPMFTPSDPRGRSRTVNRQLRGIVRGSRVLAFCSKPDACTCSRFHPTPILSSPQAH